MLQVDLLQLFDRLKNTWYHPAVLHLGAPMLAVISAFALAQTELGLFPLLGVTGSSIVAFAVLWLATSRLPKVRRGKIGIVVSVSTKGDRKATIALEGFVDELRGVVKDKFPRGFEVLVLPEYYAAQYAHSGDFESLMLRSRGHFALIGRCRAGNIDGELNYSFQLRGVVAHTEIPSEARRALSEEFGALFPRKFRVSYRNDLVGFEIAAGHIGLVAQYICGYAALLSGDLSVAQGLFESCREGNTANTHKTKRTLMAKADEKLALSHEIEMHFHYQRYRKTGQRHHLDSMGYAIDSLLALCPDHDGGHHAKAIWCFWAQRDLDQVQRHLRTCGNKNTPAWILSDAFVDAYRGNIQRAHTKYRKAFKRDVDPEVLFEVEEFIGDVLEQDDSQWRLLFLLGLLAKHKGDYVSATRDFQSFVDRCDHTMSEERALAQAFLKEVRAVHPSQLDVSA